MKKNVVLEFAYLMFGCLLSAIVLKFTEKHVGV